MNGICDLPAVSLDQDLSQHARQLSLQNLSIQWLDEFSDVKLDRLICQPSQIEEILTQEKETLPVSADAELFTGEALRQLKHFVESSCAGCDFRLSIFRADILFPSGVRWLNHPLHTVSSFHFEEAGIHLGSLFDSASATLTRFHKNLPLAVLCSTVSSLIDPFLHWTRPRSVTIAIPCVHTDSNCPALSKGTTYSVLTSEYCGFSHVPIIDSSGKSLYYYSGPGAYLKNSEFRRILVTIREVRNEMRSKAQSHPGFSEIARKRSLLQQAWARCFLETLAANNPY